MEINGGMKDVLFEPPVSSQSSGRKRTYRMSYNEKKDSESEKTEKPKHFLDRTDPHFKKDLATSIGHVAYVTQTLNDAFAKMTPNGQVTSIHCTQLETICRETVEQRRKYSDSGDIEITWVNAQGENCKAILEVKQRKTPKFESLEDFRYPSVLIDEKRLFDKIRLRGDTIGYLLTNYDRRVFLFVSHEDANENHETRTAMDRFKGRQRTFVNVPKEFFTEGIGSCALKIRQVLDTFQPIDEAEQGQRAIEQQQEKVHILETKMDEMKKLQKKLEDARTKLKDLITSSSASSSSSS